jgi:hypothetical protein
MQFNLLFTNSSKKKKKKKNSGEEREGQADAFKFD